MFLRRLLGKAKPPLAPPFDIHAHWLPGVDDGAKTTEDGLAILHALKKMGAKEVVATPHIFPNKFENSEHDLRARFKKFCEEIAPLSLGLTLNLGAEYMFCDSFFERLIQDDPNLLRFGARQELLLVELPVGVEPAALGEALDHCRRRKQFMVLAHVERYAYTAGEKGIEKLLAWRERGALLQLNASSCVGTYGIPIETSARAIWREGIIDFVASDMHSETHASDYRKGLMWLGNHSFF